MDFPPHFFSIKLHLFFTSFFNFFYIFFFKEYHRRFFFLSAHLINWKQSPEKKNHIYLMFFFFAPCKFFMIFSPYEYFPVCYPCCLISAIFLLASQLSSIFLETERLSRICTFLCPHIFIFIYILLLEKKVISTSHFFCCVQHMPQLISVCPSSTKKKIVKPLSLSLTQSLEEKKYKNFACKFFFIQKNNSHPDKLTTCRVHHRLSFFTERFKKNFNFLVSY